MSIYTLKEHLVLRSPETDFGIREQLRARLLAFGLSLMPRGNVLRCELALRAGKTLHAFAGTLPTPEFYGLIQALQGEEDLEFIGFYEYRWETWWEKSRGGDPGSIAKTLLRLGPLPIRDLYYSLYMADGRDPGEIIAYGEKNGRYYHGVVPYRTVTQIPQRGRWYSPVTAVAYDAGSLREVDVARLMPVCRSLCALGGENELGFSRKGFHFSLRNPELFSRQQLWDYLCLCQELRQLTGGKCRIWEEFVDLSGADARMVLLDLEHRENLRMTLL